MVFERGWWVGCFKQPRAALGYSALPCFSSSREREKRAVAIVAVGAGYRRHSRSFAAQSSASDHCITCAAQLSVNTCTFSHVPFTTICLSSERESREHLARPALPSPPPVALAIRPPWAGGCLCTTVGRAHRARPGRLGLYHPTHPP